MEAKHVDKKVEAKVEETKEEDKEEGEWEYYYEDLEAGPAGKNNPAEAAVAAVPTEVAVAEDGGRDMSKPCAWARPPTRGLHCSLMLTPSLTVTLLMIRSDSGPCKKHRQMGGTSCRSTAARGHPPRRSLKNWRTRHKPSCGRS